MFLLPTITRKNMKEVTALEQEEPAVQHLLHLAVLPEDQPALHQLTEASPHLDGSFWKTAPTSGSTMHEPPRKLEQVREQLIRGLPELLLDQGEFPAAKLPDLSIVDGNFSLMEVTREGKKRTLLTLPDLELFRDQSDKG